MPARREESWNVPTVRLHDGRHIPQLGLGLYKTPPDVVPRVVQDAIGLGYRHVDTASMYDNEAALAQGLDSTGLPREEVFITTKLWNSDHGYDEAIRACHRSLERLGTTYLDLYLIHWPAPRQDRYVETWHALETLRSEGLVKSIGVSNFHQPHLDRLEQHSDTTPSVNQIECHPWLQQEELLALHRVRGITTEAWSPLARGRVGRDDVLTAVAKSIGRTPAQVALRWQIHRGIVVIPKTVHHDRLVENSAIFDFDLDEHSLRILSDMDSGERTGTHPDDRD